MDADRYSETQFGIPRRTPGQHGYVASRAVEQRLHISRPAALTALRQLADLGILVEVPGGPRGQIRWRGQEILGVLTAES